MKRFQKMTTGVLYALLCLVFFGCSAEVEQKVQKIKNKPRYFVETWIWDEGEMPYWSYRITVFDSLKTVTDSEMNKAIFYLENCKLSKKH